MSAYPELMMMCHENKKWYLNIENIIEDAQEAAHRENFELEGKLMTFLLKYVKERDAERHG